MISQSMAIVITVALFVLAGVAFWWFLAHEDFDRPVWQAIGIPFVILLVAFGSLFWSANDNYYDITSGTVVSQDFTAAHMTPPTVINNGKTTTVIPGHWVDDSWAIEIRGGSGHTGWIHFESNVFSQYPIGSHYPS